MDESFVSRGYGLNTVEKKHDRQAVWSIRQAKGTQTLYYRVVVMPIRAEATPVKSEKGQISPHGFSGAQLNAAQSVLASVKARSADQETLVLELIKRLNNPQPGNNLLLLLSRKPTQVKKVLLAAQILNLARIPARLNQGIQLIEDERKTQLQYWLQVYLGKKGWQNYNIRTGEKISPSDFLTWKNGAGPLINVQGGTKPQVQFSLSAKLESALGAAITSSQKTRRQLIRFSLLSLPLSTQQVYRVLLLVPLGAFVLIIMRNLVGVATFGTFMPVLIALSFRETKLLGGILLFSLVVAMGLAVRLYMERLKLLAVPRLAAVLMVVIGLMAFLSVISNLLDFQAGLSVALFPMVILTMTIERMSIVWEERGPSGALKQGIGSIFCAALAYLVMNVKLMEHLLFVFPELLLILLAATLLLGRYAGFRLSELRRFKVLAKGN
jgi:hypothetical protein